MNELSQAKVFIEFNYYYMYSEAQKELIVFIDTINIVFLIHDTIKWEGLIAYKQQTEKHALVALSLFLDVNIFLIVLWSFNKKQDGNTA